MKFVVPSMGSIIHKSSLSKRGVVFSSVKKSWSGYWRWIPSTNKISVALSTLVTKSASLDLVKISRSLCIKRLIFCPACLTKSSVKSILSCIPYPPIYKEKEHSTPIPLNYLNNLKSIRRLLSQSFYFLLMFFNNS